MKTFQCMSINKFSVCKLFSTEIPEKNVNNCARRTYVDLTRLLTESFFMNCIVIKPGNPNKTFSKMHSFVRFIDHTVGKLILISM